MNATPATSTTAATAAITSGTVPSPRNFAGPDCGSGGGGYWLWSYKSTPF